MQFIALPTAPGGGLSPLTLSGSAPAEGFLNITPAGDMLLIGGYGVTSGTSNPTSASFTRVIGRVSLAGTVTTQALANGATSTSLQGVCSANGQDVWTASTVSGIQYFPSGATTGTSIATGNLRVPQVFGASSTPHRRRPRSPAWTRWARAFPPAVTRSPS